jgi:hypothetical protein
MLEELKAEPTVNILKYESNLIQYEKMERDGLPKQLKQYKPHRLRNREGTLQKFLDN